MLEKIHIGHMGVEKSKRRARDILYWPGMNGQIEEMILKCPTCLEHRSSNQKEPLVSQPTPMMPWDTIATDLFHWQNGDYLLVVDYFSRFFEVSKLPDTKSSTIVTYMKLIFAKHGILREVRSDNGPYISILQYRNTPVDQIGSPAQLLMSRRLRSVIPTTKSLLQPKVIDNDLASSKIQYQKALQKRYYDKGSKELPKISCGEKVRMLQGKTWNPAIVE